MTYRVLSLFAGIGGFDLGLERAGGFKTVAFCEIDPFCRRVLAKHWPGVPCYDDVRTLTAHRLAGDGISVDCIVGGFPCQDISYAGPGTGLAGDRSGLWFEFARIIGEIRPRFVVVENVTALLVRGVDAVLGTLAALGYDAEWHSIPASAIGAPHYRDRFWLVAHAMHDGHGVNHGTGENRGAAREGENCQDQWERVRCVSGRSGSDPGDATRDGRGQGREGRVAASGEAREATRPDATYADSARCIEQWRPIPIRAELAAAQRRGWWSSEPDVGRVAHGVPARVDRLRALGNAVVPQIPELIGRAILAADTESLAA
jgi:DNA (cytosine-5)-methyltransferase 1